MQVDLIKPTLTAPGTKRLKLCYDEPPSNFAFKCNLHHYNKEAPNAGPLTKAAELLNGRAAMVGIDG